MFSKDELGGLSTALSYLTLVAQQEAQIIGERADSADGSVRSSKSPHVRESSSLHIISRSSSRHAERRTGGNPLHG